MTACQTTVCRAKALQAGQRGGLALEVLTGTRSAAQVAKDEGVSRKFVGAQVEIARQAVHHAFKPSAPDAPEGADERVLFWIPVTGRLILRLVLGLILGCHSSYRGVLELLRDVLGIAISLGAIHHMVCAAAQSARQINERAELSGVRIGAHDEIFQNGQPVLVGCDVESTYGYLLSLEEHRDDVLAVAGPDVATRRVLFDFLVAELERLAPQCAQRLTPVIRALRNQRDDLLAFAEELDLSLAALAAEHHVTADVAREVLLLLTPRTAQHGQAEATLRRRLGERFHAVRTAVAALADHTVRASSVVENINSRLRNYFFLRRHLGTEYLDLLRFYLNHHQFPRSERPERVGRSPHELLTGQPQPHWLDQLTNTRHHVA